MLKKIWAFVKQEEGIESAEYAVLAAVIVLVMIAGAILLGNQINTTYTTVAGKIPGG
jgi:Flp pilus assembly pilin Flp